MLHRVCTDLVCARHTSHILHLVTHHSDDQAEAERAEAVRRYSYIECELERQREQAEDSAVALAAAEKLLNQAQAQGGRYWGAGNGRRSHRHPVWR